MNVSLTRPTEATDRPVPVRRSLRAALVALLARLFVDADAADGPAGEATPDEDEALFGHRCPYLHGLPPMY